ncbi:MAG: phenylalanine--tRNA ligase subunit beta [Candidatus Altiarchaeota archaeon]|nr:phenylalanine--tRNA ligase subunit beta [Candidatus Altiarchaeota archaeon]
MIIEILYSELVKLLKSKASLEQVIENLDMLGTPVDGFEGDLLRVEVFPNRVDMLSPEGLARALNGFMESQSGYPIWRTEPTNIEVDVKSTSRPNVSFSVVKGATLDEESLKALMQMQEKLHATVGRNRRKFSIGVYDLDKIKPPFVYKELKLKDILFRPLEEESDMTGKEVLESTEKGQKYAHLVTDTAPVIMDSQSRILSMVPILNAEFCKITKDTKNFLIDSTGTAEGTENIVSIIASTLADRGGVIGVIFPGPTFLPKRVSAPLEYINKIVGLNLNESEYMILLSKMRLGYDGDVLIPPYRLDIFNKMDIAEEIAIAYGYNKFEGELSPSYSPGEPLVSSLLDNELRKLVVGMGFLELKTFMLTSPEILKLAGGHKIAAVNSKSLEYSALRPSILPGIFDVLKFNKDADYPQKVFEIGPVFSPEEGHNISGMIVHKTANFSEIKGVVDRLIGTISQSVEWKNGEHEFFMKGRTAVSDVGVYGEVNLSISEKLGVPMTAFELDLNKLKLQERIL